jgi:DNA-binding NarL/FixJ family response regulator
MNILLADDHALFRESLHIILSMEFPESEVTHADGWTDVLERTDNKQYDLLLLDLFMPNESDNGWQSSLEKVVKNQKGSVCIISGSKNRANVKQAYELGVDGYICKTYTLKKVQEVLQVLKSGKTYQAEQLLSSFGERSKVGNGAVKITNRQREVLELLAEGESNKVISRRLGLTESTVKRHLYNIYRLLDARNRTDVIRVAKHHDLLSY